VVASRLKPLEGRTVEEIAHERGKDGRDTFLDLALEDDLRLVYTMARFDVPEDLLADSGCPTVARTSICSATLAIAPNSWGSPFGKGS
jgi:N-acyl-D-aspartate/D-glutamate deacylase